MAISANKVAPSLVVLGFVGACLWPTVSEYVWPTEKSKPAAKETELSAALFSPTMPPPITRNPWGGKDAATMAEIRKKADEAKETEKLQAEKEKEAEEGGEIAVQKPIVNPMDLLKTLSLDATSVGGGQRLAIINNRIYGQHELIQDLGADAPPMKIIEVRPYEVILECQGNTLALKYSSTSAGDAKKPEPQADGTDQEDQAVEGTPKAVAPIKTKKPAKSKLSKAGN
jgi:hypothetical protein